MKSLRKLLPPIEVKKKDKVIATIQAYVYFPIVFAFSLLAVTGAETLLKKAKQ